MNTQNLICWALGFATASSLSTICFLVYNRTLKDEGQKLIDRITAKKQVDFWYNETIQTFLGAAAAHSAGDMDTLFKYSDQHALAVRRFEDARLNLLRLE